MTTPKKKILMLTSGLAGGSFMALKNLAAVAQDSLDCTILGLGMYEGNPKGYRVKAIPYVRFDGYWGHITAKYPALGFLLQIPLYVTASVEMILRRPALVVFNGLAVMLPLMILAKLLRIKTVLSFRSWWDHDRFGKIEPIVKWYCGMLDLCYVNSSGTKENFAQMMAAEKIIVISHHANRIYFQEKDRLAMRQKAGYKDAFVMLYVGRIDEEKHCDFMIDVIKKLKNNPDFHFIFVGEGKLKDQIVDLEKTQTNVSYLGFINDPEKLSEIYTIADILWSNSDETYLARPAIEALACGTPIMVFRVPAIGEKIEKGIEIPDSMIPKEIGWIIDHRDMKGTIKTLLDLSKNNEAFKKRNTARANAKDNYFEDPNKKLIKQFIKLVS